MKSWKTCIGIWLMLAVVTACQTRSGSAVEGRDIRENISYQQTIVNYLGLPKFVHDSFAAQVLPSFARLEKYDQRGKLMYFSTPIEDFLPSQMKKLVLDTSQIEYGKPYGNGYVKLGPAYLYNRDRLLFRFPLDQLKVDSSLVFQKSFDSGMYELPLSDMRDFLAARNLYNSPALFLSDTTEGGDLYIIANHSAPIAPQGEPTLTALAEQLVLSGDSREVKAQKLLDFVTEQIEYESHGGYEIFMKPHEILLSGKTDCSGKVVLYSSLLHQVGIEHLLIYQDEHICVALPGDFPDENRMQFFHEGLAYQIAETTLPQFQIGITELHQPIVPQAFEHIQRPGYRTRLYEVATGDSLEFAVRYVPVP